MDTESSTVKLDPGEIRMDSGVQPRVQNDEAVIREYAGAMREGAEFPPVVVFSDGDNRWLAAKEAGLEEIEADVHKGARRDAVLYAAGANATHGLRRTNADKRRAVMTLLEDEEWREWSDREIARRAAVSHEFVRKMRADICQQTTDDEDGSLPTVGSGSRSPDSRKCADGRTMSTANIGMSASSEPRKKQPGEPRELDKLNETKAAGSSDSVSEPAPYPDNAPTPASARNQRGDITCVVAEFNSKPGRRVDGDASPSAIYSAFSMTPEEAVEYLRNGSVPDRPGVIMNDSDFLKVLMSFASLEKPQKEVKVVLTGEKSPAVA